MNALLRPACKKYLTFGGARCLKHKRILILNDSTYYVKWQQCMRNMLQLRDTFTAKLIFFIANCHKVECIIRENLVVLRAIYTQNVVGLFRCDMALKEPSRI